MKDYIKQGLLEGTRIMVFFAAISLIWALVIYASNQLNINPGWAMLGLFTAAIYFFSIATQKLKYESDLARAESKGEKE